MYKRIFAELTTKPVPDIVVDTEVLTVPLVGEIEVTDAAVALFTVNVPVTLPPSEFRITRFHVPGAIPFRLKILLIVSAVSVPVIVLGTVDCPVFVKVAVETLKPVPTISMVCDPLFAAFVGDRLEITGGGMVVVVPVAVKVTGDPVSDPLAAVSAFDPAVGPSVQLPTVAIPFEPVVADNPVPEPPPVATAKVTATPLTGLLFTSFTMTLGGVVTAVSTVAD